MKPLFTIPLVFLIFSCSKHEIGSPTPVTTPGVVGTWSLVRDSEWVGPNFYIEYPGAKTQVTLIMNADGTYSTELQGQPVSNGLYTLEPLGSPPYAFDSVLSFKHFLNTGLFELWYAGTPTPSEQLTDTVYQVEISIYQDTLHMDALPVNFGGGLKYVFAHE